MGESVKSGVYSDIGHEKAESKWRIPRRFELGSVCYAPTIRPSRTGRSSRYRSRRGCSP